MQYDSKHKQYLVMTSHIVIECLKNYGDIDKFLNNADEKFNFIHISLICGWNRDYETRFINNHVI